MKLNRTYGQNFFFYLILIAVFLLQISCSNSKPEIVYGFIQLVLYQEDDSVHERFSFFIIPQDEDGFENLDELYLYHDREQLRWKISSDEWVKYTQEGRDWIGTRSIAVTEGSLPGGVFRAVLINKSGEYSERNFTFDGSVRYPFPEIEVSSGVYTINSSWPVNRLVCYDQGGAYVSTVVLDSLSGDVSDLRLSASVRTAALWAEDEDNFCSAFTNVVAVGQ